VAAVATLVVVASYLIGVVVLNVVVVHRLTHAVDGRLATDLHNVRPPDLHRPTSGPNGSVSHEHGGDVDDAPTFLWMVNSSGSATALDALSPSLPRRAWTSAPVTVSIGSTPFRFRAEPFGHGWLVLGQSIAEINRVQSAAREPEIIIGLAILLVVFAGSMVIGLRAAAPLELVRRRQAEFTADASHELRTPLSVIEAEVDLALSRRRDPIEYETTLGRIGSEGKRLGRIVDDLLFLARTDAAKGVDDAHGTCDVASVSAACVDRFGALAERNGMAITFEKEGRGPFDVLASGEDVDRLIGVLVDNACKYAGGGGRVQVLVRASGGRVSVGVDDTGTGIPAEEVPHIFDRFHRVTDGSVGTGLGLAIADAVVQATRGAWTVGSSRLGGAHMEETWRRAPRHSTTTSGKRRPILDGRPGEPPEEADVSNDPSSERGASTTA